MCDWFWDTSSSSQASNCDGVLLEICLVHKFQWPQEGLNCESLAYKVVTEPNRPWGLIDQTDSEYPNRLPWFMLRYFNFEQSFKLRWCRARGSWNPLVVTGICFPNKSRARHCRSLKLGSKLKYFNINQLLLS